MKKNIIVTIIAGSFLAAGVVAPAFATNTIERSTAHKPLVENGGVPDKLQSPRTVRERLRPLKVGEVIDRGDLRAKIPARLPKAGSMTRPNIKPVPLQHDVGPGTVDLPDAANVPDVRPELINVRREHLDTKRIVIEAKAEKARILADHGGDRRAAKADLRAAQRRMVERIKAKPAPKSGHKGGKSKGKPQKGKSGS